MASAIDYTSLASMPLMEQVNTLTEHISAAEQMELALGLLNGLKFALTGVKASAKGKATASPKEPKEAKALTGGQQTWRDGLTYVWNTVKEADPKFSYKNAMKFASTLKANAEWPAPSKAFVKEAYTAWLAENPPSETASVASAGSKTSGSSSKKLADMSEDEKKAYYKARAAKAAATRAANKAAISAEAETEAEEEFNEDAKPWVYKGKTYLRAKQEGKDYLWDAETTDYVGGWNEAKKVIDKKVPAPDVE
jgi:hypothetical protein